MPDGVRLTIVKVFGFHDFVDVLVSANSFERVRLESFVTMDLSKEKAVDGNVSFAVTSNGVLI